MSISPWACSVCHPTLHSTSDAIDGPVYMCCNQVCVHLYCSRCNQTGVCPVHQTKLVCVSDWYKSLRLMPVSGAVTPAPMVLEELRLPRAFYTVTNLFDAILNLKRTHGHDKHALTSLCRKTTLLYPVPFYVVHPESIGVYRVCVTAERICDHTCRIRVHKSDVVTPTVTATIKQYQICVCVCERLVATVRTSTTAKDTYSDVLPFPWDTIFQITVPVCDRQ